MAADILPLLLDFSQPFNVTLLETTITTFYQSHNAEQVRGQRTSKRSRDCSRQSLFIRDAVQPLLTFIVYCWLSGSLPASAEDCSAAGAPGLPGAPTGVDPG
jgi:hypothetical protein